MTPGRGGALDAALRQCARRPRVAVLGTAAYAVWVTLTHDHVQDIAYELQSRFTRDVWAPAVAVTAAAALVAATVAAVRRLPSSPVRAEASAAWWGTCALLAACSVTLLATNMEAIHFLQYALPAVPVYAVTRRFGATVLVVAAIGAADEAWQYAVLHDRWAVPWDANDVILNALGASLGCASILVFASCAPVRDARRALAAPVAAIVLVLVAAFALRAAGVLALYPEEGPAPVLLSRSKRPVERWSVPDWGRAHHQAHAGTAWLVVALLVAAYTKADARVAWRDPEEAA